MVVLVAASLALTPAELTVAAEMEPEGAEATFLAEESTTMIFFPALFLLI